jgi:hypothetical protein
VWWNNPWPTSSVTLVLLSCGYLIYRKDLLLFSTHRFLWQNWVMADSDYSNEISVEGSTCCLRLQKIVSWKHSHGVYVSVVMMASLFIRLVVLAWFCPPGFFFTQHRRTKRTIFKIDVFNFNFYCLLHVSNLLGPPQRDSCVCSMVCFKYIRVSGLVERRVCSRHRPLHQSSHTDVLVCKTYHTAYTSVSLRRTQEVRNM